LLAPFARDMAGGRRLWLAPYGLLHHIPMMALPVGRNGPFLEDMVPQVGRTPNATVLLHHFLTETPSPSRGVFFGFNGDELRYAEREAQLLARKWSSEAVIGAKADIEALRQRLSGEGILHLACPGVFRPALPLQSGVFLYDSFLDVTQILKFPPVRAALTTLSSCETGQGAIRRGDEIVGLVRAWLQAGSAAVLVSLWQGDDLATMVLMDAFYEKLPTAGAASALIQARRLLRSWTIADLEERCLALGLSEAEWGLELKRLTYMWSGNLPERPLDHPYFWAAFTLHGAMSYMPDT